MENPQAMEKLVTLDVDQPIWERFFWVASLVLVGTRETDGGYDLAPKHMAMPMGWENFFGFVCTPTHRTYANLQREGVFTVSYPRPAQLVETSLAASPRTRDDEKPALSALPLFAASRVDGLLLEGGYLFLECELDRIVDGFGANSLVVGRVVAAQVAEDAQRLEERDDQALIYHSPLLAYLNPGRFASIERTLSFPFPSGMRK